MIKTYRIVKGQDKGRQFKGFRAFWDGENLVVDMCPDNKYAEEICEEVCCEAE